MTARSIAAAWALAAAGVSLGASPGAAQDDAAPGKTYWVCSILVPASLEPPVVDYIIGPVFRDDTPEAERELVQERYAVAMLAFAENSGQSLTSNVPGHETDPYCMAMDDEPGIRQYRRDLLLTHSATLAVRQIPVEWAPPGTVALASDPAPQLPPATKPGRIGVRLEPVGKNIAQRLGVPFKIGFSDTADGALLSEILPGGTGGRSGLQMMDVVTEIAGQKISTPDDVAAIVAAQRPGTLVPFAIVRFGEFKTLQVLIGE